MGVAGLLMLLVAADASNKHSSQTLSQQTKHGVHGEEVLRELKSVEDQLTTGFERERTHVDRIGTGETQLREKDAALAACREDLAKREPVLATPRVSDFARLLSPQGPSGTAKVTIDTEGKIKTLLTKEKVRPEMIDTITNLIHEEVVSKVASLHAKMKTLESVGGEHKLGNIETSLLGEKGLSPGQRNSFIHGYHACSEEKKVAACAKQNSSIATTDEDTDEHTDEDSTVHQAKVATKVATNVEPETWVAAPKYSELIKAWYIPSKSDPMIPLFGTITGKSMVARCKGPTVYDRSDAGMIKVESDKGVLNKYGKQVLRELRYGSSVPSKMCKRWARGILQDTTGKRKLAYLMQLIAHTANHLVPVLGPRKEEMPTAQCCAAVTDPQRDSWAEPEIKKWCCIKNRDPEGKGSPFLTKDPTYRRRFRPKPPCGCQKVDYAKNSPRCIPIMPKLPSQGGKPLANGGLSSGSSLGESWGKKEECKGCTPPPPGKSSRRRRGGEAHRRRAAVNKVAKSVTKTVETTTKNVTTAVKQGFMSMAQKAVKKLLQKAVPAAEDDPEATAWQRILLNAADVFFKAEPNMAKRVKKAVNAVLENPDFPIVARYSLYKTLDKRAFGGGVFGSLGLDCMFTMFFSSIITEGTYVKIEHKSATRPTIDGKPYRAGYEALMQDGPFKIRIHKCPGNYNNENPDDWKVVPGKPGAGAYDRATQNDGCKQKKGGTYVKVEPLCTADFMFDYHFCHEFEKDVDCFKQGAGTMMRKGLYSHLSVDTSQTNENAECRAWFVLMDSGFRVGFSSMTAVFTPWLMRNCMFPKEKHRDMCIPGQLPKATKGSCTWEMEHNQKETQKC